MAPAIDGTTKTRRRRTSSAGLESLKASASPATTDSSVPEAAPPVQRAMTITLHGPKRKPSPVTNEATGRPKRTRRPRATFDQDDPVELDLPPPAKSAKRALSPAPSSGLSSLSSAPPSSAGDDDSSREESPFQGPDADVTTTEAYGDFASYYVTGLDEPAEGRSTKLSKTEKDATSGKSSAKRKRKRASSVSEPAPKADIQPKSAKARKCAKPPTPRRTSSSVKATAPPSAPAEHTAQQSVLPQAPNLPLPSTRAAPVPQHHPAPANRPRPPHVPQLHQYPGPAPYPPPPSHPPPAHHVHQASHPGPRPAQPPAPVIRFIEVPHDPEPEVPDTIAIMMEKLHSLSATLTQFGGVPAVAVTPLPAHKAVAKPEPTSKKKPKPQPQPQPQPQPKRKSQSKSSANQGDQLDSFLDFFDAEDDDSEESEASPTPTELIEPEVKDFNRVLPNPGTPDSPLCYGIQFIQNALKSWAQQRMTHQIMAQWNDEQSRGFFQAQSNKARGRPKKIDPPPGGPPPVVEMNLTDTPEGVAIRKFQLVLDSGCLQANTILPVELARALRLLYMQIDSLINQGRTNDKANWYCMSYGAQIAAHNTRLQQFHEAEARQQQEAALNYPRQHQQDMAPFGLSTDTMPMTQVEVQRHHARELERRRSAQHAQQQPYISQQHLNPLQLGSQQPPTLNPNGPSPSPAPPQYAAPAINGTSGTPCMPDTGGPPKNNFGKVKMYMPGFLPRSGQSMRFSFAPNNTEALAAFGSSAFPPEGPPGPQLPNRGPMMDMPRPHSNPPLHQASVGDSPMPDAVRSPSVSNTKEHAIDLTASDGPQPEQVGSAASQPTPSNGHVGGFNPINAPVRPSSAFPSDTVGGPVAQRQNRGSAPNFPYPDQAIVIDQ